MPAEPVHVLVGDEGVERLAGGDDLFLGLGMRGVRQDGKRGCGEDEDQDRSSEDGVAHCWILLWAGTYHAPVEEGVKQAHGPGIRFLLD